VPNQLLDDAGQLPYPAAAEIGSIDLGDLGGSITKFVPH
jgi:hypothetical protein